MIYAPSKSKHPRRRFAGTFLLKLKLAVHSDLRLRCPSYGTNSSSVCVRRKAETSKIYENSSYSLREIEAATGISRSRLTRIFNCEAPINTDDLQLLGVVLSFDPRDLFPKKAAFEVENPQPEIDDITLKSANMAKQLLASAQDRFELVGGPLSIETLLKWYYRHNARIENYEQIAPFVAMFEAPKPLDNVLVPDRVGPASLASRSLNTQNPDQITRYVQGLDAKSREEIIFSYKETALSQVWQLFERDVVVDFPTAGPRVSLQYATLLLPVTAADNSKMIVNFSVLVSVSPLGLPG